MCGSQRASTASTGKITSVSLTSFLVIPDVRARFHKEFATVPFDRKISPPMQAPPITENHMLVGTAFDYLLRFNVKRLNPRASEKVWIAEQSIQRLEYDPRLLMKARL